MKNLFLLLIACAAILLQTSCERHPASQTVPGYAEKKAEQKQQERKEASQTLEANPNPPQFFPNKSE